MNACLVYNIGMPYNTLEFHCELIALETYLHWEQWRNTFKGMTHTNLCYKSMLQIYVTNLCYKSVLQICVTNLSSSCCFFNSSISSSFFFLQLALNISYRFFFKFDYDLLFVLVVFQYLHPLGEFLPVVRCSLLHVTNLCYKSMLQIYVTNQCYTPPSKE
jgi:hypothetical protein